MPFDAAEAKRLLDASNGVTAYVAPTTPMKVALMTSLGTGTAAGTEVANAGGSSYARQSFSPAAASSTTGQAASGATATFANMPNTTGTPMVAVETYDFAATPRRQMYGALTAQKTTNLGDTLTIAAGALTQSIGV